VFVQINQNIHFRLLAAPSLSSNNNNNRKSNNWSNDIKKNRSRATSTTTSKPAHPLPRPTTQHIIIIIIIIYWSLESGDGDRRPELLCRLLLERGASSGVTPRRYTTPTPDSWWAKTSAHPGTHLIIIICLLNSILHAGPRLMCHIPCSYGSVSLRFGRVSAGLMEETIFQWDPKSIRQLGACGHIIRCYCWPYSDFCCSFLVWYLGELRLVPKIRYTQTQLTRLLSVLL